MESPDKFFSDEEDIPRESPYRAGQHLGASKLTFNDHLNALATEHERVVLENVRLRTGVCTQRGSRQLPSPRVAPKSWVLPVPPSSLSTPRISFRSDVPHQEGRLSRTCAASRIPKTKSARVQIPVDTVAGAASRPLYESTQVAEYASFEQQSEVMARYLSGSWQQHAGSASASLEVSLDDGDLAETLEGDTSADADNNHNVAASMGLWTEIGTRDDTKTMGDPSKLISNSNSLRSNVTSAKTQSRRSPISRVLSKTSKSSSMWDKNANANTIFPSWYDPEMYQSSGTPRETYFDELQVMKLVAGDPLDNDSQDRSCYLISPVGTKRLFWGLCAIACLLFELWSVPFSLVYIEDSARPWTLDVLENAVTIFFSIDIILNFCTGFIEEDRIILHRDRIVKSYLTSWFAIDFVATMPWQAVLDNLSLDGIFSTLRFAKTTKALKTLKFLRLARAMRLCKTMKTSGPYTDLFASFAFMAAPLQVLATFVLFSHANGVLWAFLQPYWEPADDPASAFRMYYKSVWWAFMALTVGSTGGLDSGADRPSLWTMDIIIASERLCLIAAFCLWGACGFMSKYADEAQLTKVRSAATKYLHKREVSVKTQMQVLHNLWETGKAQNMQRHIEEFIVGALPLELQRKICEELWSAPLMSLGLIMHVAHWHDDVIPELAMLAKEEVLASKTILFQEQSAAIAAYYIIQGRITVISSESKHDIPDLVDGMWLGEKALINPMLRRSGTAVCKSICNLMNLSGEMFHSVLARYELSDEFHKFCNEFLWRGLCGRCGLLGDHFSHACPLLGASQKRRPRRAFTSFSNISSTRSNSGAATSRLSVLSQKIKAFTGTFRTDSKLRDVDASWEFDRKLKQFLLVQKLEWLTPFLKNLGVNNLEDLMKLDVDVLRAELRKASQTGLTGDQKVWVLTDEEECALSLEAIAKFTKDLLEQTGDMLSLGVKRTQHFLFLSHYKVEAGTEAALIRHELEVLIGEDKGSPAQQFAAPVFLDSEDLTNLTMLQRRVQHSHNVVLLLTENVLSRPWVLVEIVTALESGSHVLPILLMRGFNQFEFPDDKFYSTLRDGSLLGEAGCKLIQDCGFHLPQVEQAVRTVFKRIAVPYSPHRPVSIRRSELQSLLKQCRLKRSYMPDIQLAKLPTSTTLMQSPKNTLMHSEVSQE